MQGLQRSDQPQFMFGTGPGKDIHFTNKIPKLIIIQLVQFLTSQTPPGIFQAQLAGNSACVIP